MTGDRPAAYPPGTPNLLGDRVHVVDLSGKVVQAHIYESHLATYLGNVTAEEFLPSVHLCRRENEPSAAAAGIEHPISFTHGIDDLGHELGQMSGSEELAVMPVRDTLLEILPESVLQRMPLHP